MPLRVRTYGQQVFSLTAWIVSEARPLKKPVEPPVTKNAFPQGSSTAADGRSELRAIGTELSSDGLEQIAILLLAIGRENEPVCGNHSESSKRGKAKKRRQRS